MNERYIAAKERWALKMVGKAKPQVRSTDRLPPGQHEVRNFPVLDLGVRPEVPLDKWELYIHGKVENPEDVVQRELGDLQPAGFLAKPYRPAKLLSTIRAVVGDGDDYGLAAALREMKLSRHNVVAVGDAENDHSFNGSCA